MRSPTWRFPDWSSVILSLSVREHLESSESFVIQGWQADLKADVDEGNRDRPFARCASQLDLSVRQFVLAQQEAARRRLFNSILMILDQAAVSAGFDLRR
jgi:hypothetical protein